MKNTRTLQSTYISPNISAVLHFTKIEPKCTLTDSFDDSTFIISGGRKVVRVAEEVVQFCSIKQLCGMLRGSKVMR